MSMISHYIDSIKESEEFQYYLKNFGSGRLIKSSFQRKVEGWSKDKLKTEFDLVIKKTSKFSRRERDLIVYYFNKSLTKRNK